MSHLGWVWHRKRVASATSDVELAFTAHEREVGRFLVQIVGNRQLAEDLLQETFLAALRESDRLGEIENVRAWLFAVARNRALHALRSRRRADAAARRLAALVDGFQDPTE